MHVTTIDKCRPTTMFTASGYFADAVFRLLERFCAGINKRELNLKQSSFCRVRCVRYWIWISTAATTLHVIQSVPARTKESIKSPERENLRPSCMKDVDNRTSAATFMFSPP